MPAIILHGLPKVKSSLSACYNALVKAMLLAAGAGSRLQPLTDTVPKPLLPIANIPLLERSITWLARQGVDEIVINIHHRAETIIAAIGSGERFGVSIRYSHEHELLGTSGAVKRCRASSGPSHSL